MRIAMITAHSSPLATLGSKEAGGMNVYVRELSRELGRRNVAVDIFTRMQNPDMPMINLVERNVRVINLRAGPPTPYDKNWLLTHLPEFVSRIRCFADGEDLVYDLIHSHYWLSGEAALALRRGWNVPIVHMAHTLAAKKNRVARSAEERETALRATIERHIAANVDALIAATPMDRADLVWHCGADTDQIEVVPCGVDLRRFQPLDLAQARATLDLPPPPMRFILLVGRIEPLKGIDALIEAIAILHQRHPAWRTTLGALVVGGHSETERSAWNSEQRRLDALRQRFNVVEAVRFVGTENHERLAQFYAAANIVTMPSHYESFGMAALEGMACGRPVVATSAGGPSFTIEDGISGLLTPPDNPQVLADRFEQLLLNPDLSNQLATTARSRAERFGWTTIASEMMALYQQVRERAALRRMDLVYATAKRAS
jgi:D-inositol-3-phosphate glycosyltransferase